MKSYFTTMRTRVESSMRRSFSASHRLILQEHRLNHVFPLFIVRLHTLSATRNPTGPHRPRVAATPASSPPRRGSPSDLATQRTLEPPPRLKEQQDTGCHSQDERPVLMGCMFLWDQVYVHTNIIKGPEAWQLEYWENTLEKLLYHDKGSVLHFKHKLCTKYDNVTA